MQEDQPASSHLKLSSGLVAAVWNAFIGLHLCMKQQVLRQQAPANALQASC